MAVKEMNGIEIKEISKCATCQNSWENIHPPLSSKNGNKVSFSNLEKVPAKKSAHPPLFLDCPELRQRQLGSEQTVSSSLLTKRLVFLIKPLNGLSYAIFQ